MSKDKGLSVDRHPENEPDSPDGPDWFALLDKARDNGREYAFNGLAHGEVSPLESPLSGEWADGITPRDVVNMAAGRDDAYDIAEDFEVDDLCSSWEDGYLSAPWPDPACPQCGGPWGADITCDRCTDSDGVPRSRPDIAGS